MPRNLRPLCTSPRTRSSVSGSSQTTTSTAPATKAPDTHGSTSQIDTLQASSKPSSALVGYDEVFTPDGGVRAPYATIVPLLEKRTLGQVSRFEKQTLKDFHGDRAVVTVPRVLSQTENGTLRTGVAQRAKAVTAFLKDYYSGKKSFIKGNVIPEAVLEQIIARASEGPVKGWLNPEDIGFFYGPDLIRGPDGKFFIIEDNLGYVGGMGDLLKARKVMFQHMPELRGAINTPKPDSFYADMAKSFREQCKGGGDTVVFLRYPNYACSDRESERLQKILLKHGIETVVVDNIETERYRNQLEVKPDGVYLKTKGKQPKKVGYVVAHMEPGETDPSHPAVYVANLKRTVNELIEEIEAQQKALGKTGPASEAKSLAAKKARFKALLAPKANEELDISKVEKALNADNPDAVQDLKESGIQGLLNAFYQGQVGMHNSPGTEFIGDKELYMFVENMIRFYLKEEPVIRNLPTQNFRTYNQAGNGVLNQKLFDQVFDEKAKNKDSHVIKRVDGRGGDGVWVGSKISWKEFASLKDAIKAEPDAFIVQQYTPLSQVDGHLVDLRHLSTINSKGPIVAPVAFGRAVPAEGSNGKVNISDKGSEQAVMVAGPMSKAPKGKQSRASATPAQSSSRATRSGADEAFTPYKIRHIGK